MMILSSLSMAEQENKWFMELGYQVSTKKIDGTFTSTTTTINGTQTGISSTGESWGGVLDNLYLKMGRKVEICEKYSLAPSLGFTQASLLGDEYHSDALFLELPLFYKTEFLATAIEIGPSLKYIYYPNNYYNSKVGQVDFGRESAFAYGLQSLWGKGNTKFSLGIEKLTSASSSAISAVGNIENQAIVNANALYVNLGIHIGF